MSAAEVLGAVLRMNLAAGVAILGVMALRKLFRPRFGARLAYGLWLLPVLAGAAALSPARQVVIVRSAARFASATGVHAALLAAPARAAAGLDPLALLVGLWLAGTLGAVLIMAHLQRRFMRRARGGEMGPAVVGVLAPRILTPRDFAERYSPGEQALVLAHEQAHIARQDSRLNGLCAAAQCLCWFNPLVHLAARLMRIDQELACDEAVVSRFPDARRAYAEVLVKAQMATLPLPLGCYWPSAAEHPLVERVAMLRRKHIGAARRSIGVAALAVLCAGAGVAAWASEPADVRIVTRRAVDIRFAQPAPGRLSASEPDSGAAGDTRAAPTSDGGDIAPDPAKTAAGNGFPDQTSPDAAAPRIALARNDASPILAPAVAQPDAAPESSGQAAPPPQTGALDAEVMPQTASEPTPVATRAPGPPLAMVKISQKAGSSEDPDKVICRIEAVTGSRFTRHVCLTRSDWRAQQIRLFVLERFWLLDPSGYSAGDD